MSAALTEVIDEGIALHAAVVSLSVSRGEHVLTSVAAASLNAALEQARARHVTIVASSGDTGAIADDGPPRQVSLPASDPLVLAVGGTALERGPGRRLPGRDGLERWQRRLRRRRTASCSPVRPTRTASPGPVPPEASLTWPPTRTPTPRWRKPTAPGEPAPGLGHAAPPTPLWAALITLADQAGGPAPRLRQPGHLPDRPRPRPPPGIP